MKPKKHHLALMVRAPLSVRTILEALILDHPCAGIEEKEDGFLACFPERTSRSDVLHIINMGKERIKASGVSEDYSIVVQEIPYTDWSVRWKDRFSPVEAGRKLIIKAPWHAYTGGRVPVIIEPSMAFGTGDHPTTRLCLEAIEECAASRRPAGLLDIGTGTGILSIAAAKLGFRPVTAIDIDPLAREIARENIRTNNTPGITVSDAAIYALQGTFDVIVGNLTAETVKEVFDESLKRLDRGGTCIFSGVLHAQKDDMVSFFRDRGLRDIEERGRDGWFTFVLRPSK